MYTWVAIETIVGILLLMCKEVSRRWGQGTPGCGVTTTRGVLISEVSRFFRVKNIHISEFNAG